ncbi:hypothetical protein DU976_20725 [Vibrio navarrensis]|nr:hypothetical protein [Vibrio navarrensis]EJL6396860.1 hypothetical protein [Vibrio navarrensis]
MKNRIFIILLISTLSGCVGVWTDYDLKTQSGLPSDFNKNQSYSEWSDLTKNDVVSRLGNPEKTLKSSGGERWVYPYKTAWKGIYLLAVIVPIPLKIPSGDLNVLIDFDGDNAVSISHEYFQGKIYACGPGVWFMTGLTHGDKATFCGSGD